MAAGFFIPPILSAERYDSIREYPPRSLHGFPKTQSHDLDAALIYVRSNVHGAL